MSNVTSKANPVSPTPTLFIEQLGKIVDDYKQSKSAKSDVSSSTTLSSSLSSSDVQKRESDRVDLSKIQAFLPDDPQIQNTYISKLIEYYAGIGQLDCFSNFDTKSTELLGDSWRRPKGIKGLEHDSQTWWSSNSTGVDTRMTTTEWGDLLSNTNQVAGRLINIVPGTSSSTQEMWNRQTDVVKMKHFSLNLMITPTINLSGSEPPLMDAEQQVVDVLFFVDTYAVMSNKINGFGVPILLVETAPAQATAPNNVNAIFSLVAGGGTPPTQVYRYPTAMPNPVTKDSRFHILYHRRFPIKYYSNWIDYNDGSVNRAVQTPGEVQYHQIEVPLSPFLMPFSGSGQGQPFMNNCYMLISGNTSTTTSSNYYSIVHYQLKAHWQDVGNQ